MTEPGLPAAHAPSMTHREGSAVARRRAAAALVVAGVLAAMLTWAVAAGGSALSWLDEALTRLTRGWADPLGWPVELTRVAGEATAPRNSALLGAVAVVVLLVARRRAAAAWVALSGLLGVLTAEAIKTTMGRQRPPGAGRFEPDLDKSFPSGHAMVGIYLYLVIGLVLVQLGRAGDRRWLAGLGWFLVLLSPLIGLTRLVLGVHWPSDLVAGWAYGSVVALGTALLLWWPLDRGWAAAPSQRS